MLDHGGLYLAAASHLGDPFEGSFPRLDVESRRSTMATWDALTHAEYSETFRKFAAHTYVSCWHMNDGESAAMWRLYAKTDEAVAVQTTYQKLRDALDEETIIGRVTYLDFETERTHRVFDAFTPFHHKRRSFEHEREARLIVQRPPYIDGLGPRGPEPRNLRIDFDRVSEAGIWKHVDLNSLIDNVYVAPSAPAWFGNLVESVARRFGARFAPSPSSMDAAPLY